MQPVIDQARQLTTEALHDRAEPLTQEGWNLDTYTAANHALQALNAFLSGLGRSEGAGSEFRQWP
jgi:hypothetical protein